MNFSSNKLNLAVAPVIVFADGPWRVILTISVNQTKKKKDFLPPSSLQLSTGPNVLLPFYSRA